VWNLAYETNGTLTWCDEDGFENQTAVPIPVHGDTRQPFLLVSFPQPEPNLRAVGLGEDLKIANIVCLHSIDTINELKSQKGAISQTVVAFNNPLVDFFYAHDYKKD